MNNLYALIATLMAEKFEFSVRLTSEGPWRQWELILAKHEDSVMISFGDKEEFFDVLSTAYGKWLRNFGKAAK